MIERTLEEGIINDILFPYHRSQIVVLSHPSRCDLPPISFCFVSVVDRVERVPATMSEDKDSLDQL